MPLPDFSRWLLPSTYRVSRRQHLDTAVVIVSGQHAEPPSASRLSGTVGPSELSILFLLRPPGSAEGWAAAGTLGGLHTSTRLKCFTQCAKHRKADCSSCKIQRTEAQRHQWRASDGTWANPRLPKPVAVITARHLRRAAIHSAKTLIQYRNSH